MLRLTVGTLLIPALVLAQDVHFLDCAQVSFYTPGCVSVQLAPPPAPVEREPLAPQPFFTKETIAPHAPPLLVRFFNDMTVENADAYLDWQEERGRLLKVEQEFLELRRQERLAHE